jgi:hypothetical protein
MEVKINKIIEACKLTTGTSDFFTQRRRKEAQMGNFDLGSYLDLRAINEELLNADKVFN